MNVDNFELILNNLKELKAYIKSSKAKTQVSTYHLITDNDKVEQEIKLYQDNVINKVQSIGYIWKMHNLER